MIFWMKIQASSVSFGSWGRIRPIPLKNPPFQRNPPCFAPKILGGYGIYGRAAENFGGFDVIYHRKPIKNDVLNVFRAKIFRAPAARYVFLSKSIQIARRRRAKNFGPNPHV